MNSEWTLMKIQHWLKKLIYQQIFIAKKKITLQILIKRNA